MDRPSRQASRTASSRIKNWATDEAQPEINLPNVIDPRQQRLNAAVASSLTSTSRASLKRERDETGEEQYESKRINLNDPSALPKVEVKSEHPLNFKHAVFSRPKQTISGSLYELCDTVRVEEDSRVRRRIAVLLGATNLIENSSAQCISTLQYLCSDVNAEVRSSSLTALVRIVKELNGLSSHPKSNEWITSIADKVSPALKDEDFRVRQQGLALLATVAKTMGTSQKISLGIRASELLEDADPRVRAQGFRSIFSLMESRLVAQDIPISCYTKARSALADDDESVRSAAIDLICRFGSTVPKSKVGRAIRADTDAVSTKSYIVDDSFVTLCDMVTDLSPRVRAQASKLLGSLSGIAEEILTQTFDKKVMSHLKKKLTEHEMQRKSDRQKSAGHLAAADPGDFDAHNMSLMSSGACGAFVHGLEDEFFEVREAAIHSICLLCQSSDALAKLALDFMADMFNDEIDSVRIKAIDGMRGFGGKVIFLKQQIELMLGMLEDASSVIRESMHELFSVIHIASFSSLDQIVQKLIANAKKYPIDIESIWKCFKGLGINNPIFAGLMVEPLLRVGVHFATAEPNVDDAIYIGIVIMLSAAGSKNQSILTLLPSFFPKHHRYLRDKLGDLVFDLDFLKSTTFSVDPFHAPVTSNSLIKFSSTSTSSVGKFELKLNDVTNRLRDTAKRLGRTSLGIILKEIQAVGADLLQIRRHHHAKQRGVVQVYMQLTVWLRFYCRNLHQTLSGSLAFDTQSLDYELLYRIEATHESAKGLRPTLVVLRAFSHAQVLLLRSQFNKASLEDVHTSIKLLLQRVEKLTELDLDRTSPLANFVGALGKSCLQLYQQQKPDEALENAISSLQKMLLTIGIPMPTEAVIGPASKAVILSPLSGRKPIVFQKGLPLSIEITARITNVLDRTKLRIQVKYPDGRSVEFVPVQSQMRDTRPSVAILESTIFVASERIASSAFKISITVGVVSEIDVLNDPILPGNIQTNSTSRYFPISKPLEIPVWPKVVKRKL